MGFSEAIRVPQAFHPRAPLLAFDPKALSLCWNDWGLIGSQALISEWQFLQWDVAERKPFFCGQRPVQEPVSKEGKHTILESWLLSSDSVQLPGVTLQAPHARLGPTPRFVLGPPSFGCPNLRLKLPLSPTDETRSACVPLCVSLSAAWSVIRITIAPGCSCVLPPFFLPIETSPDPDRRPGSTVTLNTLAANVT